ncbi:hypothetical protein AAVH_38167 [Aphelenchoides avenae]|nr:hypothetical protein AAVH_38167 [Aphelenchus avenae]
MANQTDIGPTASSLDAAMTVVETLLMAFHVTVFACVVRSLLRKSHFASGAFFKVFAIKCVADYVAYAIGTGVWRLAQANIIGTIEFKPLLWALNFLLIFSLFFQTAADTVISATRYTAISHPMLHQKLWVGNWLKLMIGALFSVPALFAMLFAVIMFVLPSIDREATGNILAALAVGLTLTCSIASAIMVTRALYAYFKMTRNRKRANREEFRLLIYALLSLTAQIALAGFFGIEVLVQDQFHGIRAVARRNFPFLVSFLSLAGPFYLMSTCKSVRLAYGKMFCKKFAPGNDETRGTVLFTSTNSGQCRQSVQGKASGGSLGYGFRGRRVHSL